MSHQAFSALSRYPVPDPRLFESLPASIRNDNFLVEDALGEQYVLRHYRRNPHKERIDFQLRLQQHLLRHGLPTSRVIETSGGDRVVVLGDDCWALFTFIRGTDYEYEREGQAREAARWLARNWWSENQWCRRAWDDTEFAGDSGLEICWSACRLAPILSPP